MTSLTNLTVFFRFIIITFAFRPPIVIITDRVTTSTLILKLNYEKLLKSLWRLRTLPFRFFLLFFPSSSLYFFFFSFFDLDFESSSDECLRLSRDLDLDLDLVRSLLLQIYQLCNHFISLTHRFLRDLLSGLRSLSADFDRDFD